MCKKISKIETKFINNYIEINEIQKNINNEH